MWKTTATEQLFIMLYNIAFIFWVFWTLIFSVDDSIESS